MRWLSHALFWMMLFPLVVASGSSKTDRPWINGVEYTRLEDWAAANRFQVEWTAPRQSLKLFSKWSTLVFTVDSRRMTLNGVAVWLAAPIAYRNGSACMGTRDVATVLNPVLFPEHHSGRAIRTICLDPGHGGRDPGNRAGAHQEKKYALLLAKELGAQLTKAGFKVHLTRGSDTFLDLPLRPELARRRGADLLLSLHFNSAAGAGGAAVHGTEVYCMTPAWTSSTNARGEGGDTGAYPGNRADAKNILLAYHVQKALLKNLGTEDRGVRRARFAVLRAAEMPAVLIEGGFMSHPAEAKKIYDATYRRRMAQAIVEGVLAYKARVEP